MSPKDAIRMGIDAGDMITNAYINDLDDSELLLRPVPGMNHIAWQLGHLIAAERHFVEMIKPGSCPALPEGFAEAHSKETSTLDDPVEVPSRGPSTRSSGRRSGPRRSPFSTAYPKPTSTRPTPVIRNLPRRVAALLGMVGTHALMHCGQFVAVRRKVGKPVVI